MMMHRGGTPPPRIRSTPSRCLCRSRPFLDLPTPFLCAMVSWPLLRGSTDPDFGHGKRGERLAMALFLRKALPPLVLVYGDLLPLAVPDCRADHGGALDGGSPHGGPLVGRHHQHVREFDGRAGLDQKLLHVDDIARGDAELLPPGADNSVHRTLPS